MKERAEAAAMMRLRTMRYFILFWFSMGFTIDSKRPGKLEESQLVIGPAKQFGTYNFNYHFEPFSLLYAQFKSLFHVFTLEASD